MIKKGIIILGTAILLFGTKTVYACGGSGCYLPSPTPYPTVTPYPTETPYPTWTPYPTPTLFPTPTPFPTGAPETGPEDTMAVPLLLGMGGLGIAIRTVAKRFWE